MSNNVHIICDLLKIKQTKIIRTVYSQIRNVNTLKKCTYCTLKKINKLINMFVKPINILLYSDL